MKSKKKKWSLIYKGDVNDFDDNSLDYWSTQSAEKKFLEVENLRKEYKTIKGISKQNESGLDF